MLAEHTRGVGIGRIMSGRARVKNTISNRRTKASRAGLVFPVSRILRYMRRDLVKRRIAAGAPVYLGAVLEYLCAEVLELAGKAANDNKRRTIAPRHLLLAIANDDELSKLLRGVTISSGGVLPQIHPVLLHRNKELRKFWKKSGSTPTQPSKPSQG